MKMQMKKPTIAFLGALILSAEMGTATTPESALGDCGPDRHSDIYGCRVWGGQREGWCMRHTGHMAGRGPLGTR